MLWELNLYMGIGNRGDGSVHIMNIVYTHSFETNGHGNGNGGIHCKVYTSQLYAVWPPMKIVSNKKKIDIYVHIHVQTFCYSQ